jgi:hypothetical protein
MQWLFKIEVMIKVQKSYLYPYVTLSVTSFMNCINMRSVEVIIMSLSFHVVYLRSGHPAEHLMI